MKNTLKEKVENLKIKTKAKLLTTEILYKGNFIKLLEETYRLPNNKILKRERIEKNKNKKAVIIVAITPDSEFILISQNRINNICTLEFPSGYIEPGEKIEEAAIRELKEETGYSVDKITILDSYMTSIGIDSSIVYIVFARNCIKTNNQNLGINEYINYELFTYEELKDLINENVIISCGNKLAFYKIKELI